MLKNLVLQIFGHLLRTKRGDDCKDVSKFMAIEKMEKKTWDIVEPFEIIDKKKVLEKKKKVLENKKKVLEKKEEGLGKNVQNKD